MDRLENTVVIVMGVTDRSTIVWYPNLGGNFCEVWGETNFKPGDFLVKFDGKLVKIQESLPTTIARNSPLFKIKTLTLKPASSYFSEGNPGFDLREYSSFVGLSVHFGPVMLSRTVSRRMKTDILYELEFLNFKQTVSIEEQVNNTWTVMDTLKTVWFCCSWPKQSEKDFADPLSLDPRDQGEVKDYNDYLEKFSHYQISLSGNSENEEVQILAENIPTVDDKSESEDVDSWIRNILGNHKMRTVMEQCDPESYYRICQYYNETR